MPAERFGTLPSPSAPPESSKRVAARIAAACSGIRNSLSCTLLSSSILARICSMFSAWRYSGLTHLARYSRSSSSGQIWRQSSSSSRSSLSPSFFSAWPPPTFLSSSAAAASFTIAAMAAGNGVKSSMSSSPPVLVCSCVSVACSDPLGASAAWYQPLMLSRGLSSAKTSCTEWKLLPGCTVKNAMLFHAGSSSVVGSTAGVPGSMTGYSSSAPPSLAVHPSSGSVR
mmetsp:Transcript_10117/g.39512  ORF Transcript_10117/g.39512 Transcript_10117/m.39512 type:complete len:227 (-) Transcript_10117:575-1255(-)